MLLLFWSFYPFSFKTGIDTWEVVREGRKKTEYDFIQEYTQNIDEKVSLLLFLIDLFHIISLFISFMVLQLKRMKMIHEKLTNECEHYKEITINREHMVKVNPRYQN